MAIVKITMDKLRKLICGINLHFYTMENTNITTIQIGTLQFYELIQFLIWKQRQLLPMPVLKRLKEVGTCHDRYISLSK